MRILFLLPFALAAQSPDADVEKLRWLTGCVEARTANGWIEEHWTKPAGGSMMGMGRTVRNGKMVDSEYQKISVEAGKIVYTARIGTKGMTLFPMKSMSGTEIVFENPEHDFPQRVIYRKTAEGVHARIEGVVKGKERHQDFPYKRVACE